MFWWHDRRIHCWRWWRWNSIWCWISLMSRTSWVVLRTGWRCVIQALGRSTEGSSCNCCKLPWGLSWGQGLRATSGKHERMTSTSSGGWGHFYVGHRLDYGHYWQSWLESAISKKSTFSSKYCRHEESLLGVLLVINGKSRHSSSMPHKFPFRKIAFHFP